MSIKCYGSGEPEIYVVGSLRSGDMVCTSSAGFKCLRETDCGATTDNPGGEGWRTVIVVFSDNTTAAKHFCPKCVAMGQCPQCGGYRLRLTKDKELYCVICGDRMGRIEKRVERRRKCQSSKLDM